MLALFPSNVFVRNSNYVEKYLVWLRLEAQVLTLIAFGLQPWLVRTVGIPERVWEKRVEVRISNVLRHFKELLQNTGNNRQFRQSFPWPRLTVWLDREQARVRWKNFPTLADQPRQSEGRGQEELDKTRHSKSPRVSWPGRNTSELLDQTTNWIQTRKTRSMRLYYVIINHCFLSILSCKQLQLNIPSPYISLIIYITKMWQFIGFQKTKSIYIGTALKYILTRQLPDGCFGCQKQISWPINETPSWFKPVCDHFSASATHMGLRCGPHIFLAYRPTTQDCGKWADVWQNIYGYQLA